MKTRKLSSLALLCAGLCLSVPVARPAQADPPTGQGYVPVMAEEFNGTGLDTNIWGYNYPWGHIHNGRAAMEASQVKLGSGVMDLQAIWSRDPNVWGYTNNTGGFWDNSKSAWVTVDFTSGTIYSKKRWKYGYFEGRFLVPWQASTWPAFWMLQDGWPPELDIFEFHGSSDSENYTYHYTGSSGAASWGGSKSGLAASGTWHTYGVDWSADHLTYYIDGKQIASYTNSTYIGQMGAMYILIDHQIAGWAPDPVSGDGQTWPADFKADYVRVWQKNAPGPANGIYRLTPQSQPTMALHVSAANTTYGPAVDIAPATYASNQKWSLTQQTDGTYVIGALADTTSTLRLDYSTGGTANGDLVATRPNTGGMHQRWYLLSAGSGWYRFIPVTAPGKTLDITGGSSSGAGAASELWDFNGGSNQLFRLDVPYGPLTVTGVGVASAADTQISLGWNTNNPADTLVDYGPTTSYGSNATGSTGVTSHGLALTGLTPRTTYHYRVRAKDSYGQTNTSSDAVFTTAAPAVPQMAIWNTTLARDSATQDIVATVTLKNGGTGSAANVQITGGTLASSHTTTPLPQSVGPITSGGSAVVTLRFLSQPAGTATTLQLTGAYTGGTFGGSSRVRVP